MQFKIIGFLLSYLFLYRLNILQYLKFVNSFLSRKQMQIIVSAY